VIDDFVRINFFAGHAIFAVGPPAEIDQFTTLRTEGAPGVLLPLNRFSTLRAFRHKAKVRRKQGKVKAAGKKKILSSVAERSGDGALVCHEFYLA
jgi:hypothetical protein